MDRSIRGGRYATILAVEGEELTARQLKEWLEPRGFELHCVATGREALAQLDCFRYDLILVAFFLPDRDGLSLCREIRRHRNIPLIIASSTGHVHDEVSSLEAGADDFLVKPLQPSVTLARIRALFRRCRPQGRQNDARPVGDLVLDRRRLQVFFNGEPLGLTPTEFKLLQQLSSGPNRAFSREILLSKVWDTSYLGDKRVVDTHIRNLRRKLIQSGSTVLIHSVRGVGYRLASGTTATVPLPSPA